MVRGRKKRPNHANKIQKPEKLKFSLCGHSWRSPHLLPSSGRWQSEIFSSSSFASFPPSPSLRLPSCCYFSSSLISSPFSPFSSLSWPFVLCVVCSFPLLVKNFWIKNTRRWLPVNDFLEEKNFLFPVFKKNNRKLNNQETNRDESHRDNFGKNL